MGLEAKLRREQRKHAIGVPAGEKKVVSYVQGEIAASDGVEGILVRATGLDSLKVEASVLKIALVYAGVPGRERMPWGLG